MAHRADFPIYMVVINFGREVVICGVGVAYQFDTKESNT